MATDTGIKKLLEIAKATIDGIVIGAFLGLWMGGGLGGLAGAAAIGLLALAVKTWDVIQNT
jgi:hypothetical protein